MPFSIVERDGHIVVTSPYHPNFPARARGLGGEWDAVRHVWVFDAAEQDRVTALCREIYSADVPETGKDRSAPFPNAPARGRNSNQFAEGAARPHYYGHRDRLRERMMAAGADTLPDYELLEIFISDVVFEYNFLNGLPGDYDVPLNYDLKKGATSNVSLKLREFAMFVNTTNRDFGLVVANKSGKISEKLLAEAFSYNPQKCVSVRFVTTTHPQFTRMSHYYNTALSEELAVTPIRAHINIVSHRTGMQSSVPLSNVVAIFGVTHDFGCRLDDWVTPSDYAPKQGKWQQAVILMRRAV